MTPIIPIMYMYRQFVQWKAKQLTKGMSMLGWSDVRGPISIEFSSTLNETREDKNVITTLKSKVNQLIKEKEALANALPIIIINFIMY